MNVGDTLQIHRATNASFDDLIADLAVTFGWAVGMQAQQKGSAHGWTPNETASAQSHALGGAVLTCRPFALMQALTEDRWPDAFEWNVTAGPQMRVTMLLTQMQRVEALSLGGTFIRYWEAIVPAIAAKQGKVDEWTPTAQFGRTIRNAFAHGGCVSILDPRPPGAWRGITYSISDNGTPVLHNALGGADIWLLMTDLDSEF